MWSIRFVRRYLLHPLICACALVPAVAPAQEPLPPAAVLPPQAADRAALALMAARARHAPLALYAPTAFPGALSEGLATDVKFTVLLAGGAASAQPEVRLHIGGLDTSVPMQDDGLGSDLSAGDRIYSALVQFSAADATVGRCYDARVSAFSTSGQTVLSGVRRVCVSRFTVGIAASDFSSLNVIDFSDGTHTTPVVADEALIRVSSNLSDDRIEAIAALVGGTVVGGLPEERIYQIRLPGSQTAEELRQTLDRLQRAGGVLLAVPNAIGGLQAPPVVPLTTSDPQLATQLNLDRIKAKHAWAITTGDATQLIAIIDTGADFDHPDFWATPSGTDTRFAISGSNLVAADCTGGACVAVSKPLTCHATNVCNASNAATDTYGHGTLVAGFTGAFTDNELDIAGATWQGRLLAVRYAANNATATVGNLLESVNYARGQGARILSISTANPTTFFGNIICPAVAGAESEGRLVVAAAGNDGATTNNYPGACAGAMPVANSGVNVSDQDVIHAGTLASNLGTWISVAAPGAAVVSTARTAAACPTCDAAYTSATGYASVTGTSFSTPLAAGAAGLVLARSPSITNADLRTLLFSTGVPLQTPAAHIKRIDLLAALLTFNTAPTAINLSGLCIPENTDSTAGASVGTLTTVDADAGLTGFEYTVVGGADQAKFTIGGINADQLIITDGVLNFEAQASYAVTVRSTDVGNAFFEQPLVVAVCNINEPPIVADTTTFPLPENSPAATVVGTLVASDPEGGPLAFAISGGNTLGAFAIDGSTGAITVANPMALDYESTPGHAFSLTVEVSDGMNTLPVTVTVELTDVDEPPTITGAIFTVTENQLAGTALGSVGGADPEGQALTYSITVGNTEGAFTVLASGQLTVVNPGPISAALNPIFNLTVMVSDGSFIASAPVTVNVTALSGAIPNPILVFDHKYTDSTSDGTFDYYRFTVANWYLYPGAMFVGTNLYGSCGLNTEPSRTWVDFFSGVDNSRIYGFCALGEPYNLNLIWFAVPTGTAPPANVYIKLIDRSTTPYTEYPSNTVAPPFP